MPSDDESDRVLDPDETVYVAMGNFGRRRTLHLDRECYHIAECEVRETEPQAYPDDQKLCSSCVLGDEVRPQQDHGHFQALKAAAEGEAGSGGDGVHAE